LAVCRRKKPGRARRACKAKAQKTYGPIRTAAKARKSSGGSKR
jgi:hypothetical protein